MATIPFEIPLYIDHPQQAIKFRLQQNDVNSLQIIITIYEDNEEFIIPIGYPVYLRMLKPDNKVVYNECSVENNKAIFSVTAQMTAMHGRASAQLEIIDPVSGGNVKTIRFHALIDEEVISDSQIESSDEFTALQSMAIYIADFSSRIEQIGDLSLLNTTSNTDLVGAINENTDSVAAINNNLVEEVVAISYASGVHGFCLKNKVTRKISLWVSIITPQNNPTVIATLPAGLVPAGGATIRSLAKQSSGIGECQLNIQSDGQVILSAIDYNEPMGGVIFNLFWMV